MGRRLGASVSLVMARISTRMSASSADRRFYGSWADLAEVDQAGSGAPIVVEVRAMSAQMCVQP